MRRSKKIIFWIFFLGLLGGLGYFLFGDLGSDVPKEGSEEKVEVSYDFSFLENYFSSNDIKKAELSGLYMSPNGRYVVYGIPGFGIKVYDALTKKEKNISTTEELKDASFKANRMVISTDKGFHYLDIEKNETVFIPGKIKNAVISEEADLIAYQEEKGMKLYNIKEKTIRELSFSGFDTPFMWFGDNKRFIGAKDTGKEINSTSHGQVISIYDTTYGSWTDIEKTELVKVYEDAFWTSKGYSFFASSLSDASSSVTIGIVGEDKIVDIEYKKGSEIYTASGVYKKVAVLSSSSISIFDSKGNDEGSSEISDFVNLKPVFAFFNTNATVVALFEDATGDISLFEINTVDGKVKPLGLKVSGKIVFVNEEKRNLVFQIGNGIRVLDWSEIK